MNIRNEIEMSVLFAESHLGTFKQYDTIKGLDRNYYPTHIRVLFTNWMDDQYSIGNLTEDQVNSYTLIAFNDLDFENYMSQNPIYPKEM